MKIHGRNGGITKKIMDKFTNVNKKKLLDKNSVHRYLLRYLHVKREKQPNFFSILLLITLVILI